MKKVSLSSYDNEWFDSGKGILTKYSWYLINALVLKNSLNPFSCTKIWALKAFNAKIGKGVVIKPCVNIKYPWNVVIGNNSWIGENVWLDSLAMITVGDNVCISQGAYLCTGNHDWNDTSFGLFVKPIKVEDGVWIGANTTILPGVTIANHSVISAGMSVSKDTEEYRVYLNTKDIISKQRFDTA